jgi:hypothetical protein
MTDGRMDILLGHAGIMDGMGLSCLLLFSGIVRNINGRFEFPRCSFWFFCDIGS